MMSKKELLLFQIVLNEKLHLHIYIFFFDGTFKSCSKQYLQIYRIHVDIGSISSETNVIPVIFVLLPNKTKNIYTRLFKLIKEHIPNFNPNIITIDFEAATIQAIKDVFPNTQISGCNYHFNQSLWRKVQNVGLVDEYRDNEKIQGRNIKII